MNKLFVSLDNEKETIIHFKEIKYRFRFYNIAPATKGLIKKYFINKEGQDFYVKNKIYINSDLLFELEDRQHSYSKTKKLGNSTLCFVYRGMNGYVELEFNGVIHNANGPALVNLSNGVKKFYIDNYEIAELVNGMGQEKSEIILKKYKQARDAYVIKKTVSGEN